MEGGATVQVPTETTNQPRRGGVRGRGRGGQSRGGANTEIPSIPTDRGEERFNGRGRSRPRGRGGRGGRGNRDRAASNTQASTVASEQSIKDQISPDPGGEAIEDLTSKAAVVDEQAIAEDDTDAELCQICANPVTHWTVTPCNHRYCHVCGLRLRALYKTKTCAYCRTDSPTVILTDDSEKRYGDFDQTTFYKSDGNLGICFETNQIYDDTVFFLRYNCPDPSCDVACIGWPDLHRHVRSVHHKLVCDLCTRNKKVFTHEHDLFTQQELRKHEKHGDDNPGAVDQSGFQGHPECGFCRKRFYGEDELYVHCRESHERCHLCDRRTGGQNPQYYLNYDALEQHFNRDHHPCLDSECQEKKFVVFDSEMDLKAHQLEAHPNGMSKDVRRDARRVDISSFDYRPQYVEPRRGGRRGGRGRDPNTDVMPATSGGQMSRAEMAHQREREIHTTSSATPRMFGGQLSQAEPQAQTVQRPANTQSPRPRNAQPAPAAASPSPRAAEATTTAEQARRLRHAAVTERAANLLGNDQTKLDEFRERIKAYRNGTITASDLIDAFFSLFDTSSAELGKLIKELVDIFEITAKRDNLLKAWSDWRAINEDYPSLPGPTGATSAAGVLGSGIGGSRVLKLKSSTAPSSNTAMQRQRSWGAAASSANNPFPALPAGTGANGASKTSGWLKLKPSATATSNSASSSARASPAPSRIQSTVNVKKLDAFPALPAAKKPTSTVFSPGYTGSGILRPNTGTPVSAWSASGMANGGTAPLSPPAVDESEAKGKGKGRKKQVIFNWG